MSNKNVQITFNVNRIYNNLDNAQKWLDMTVMQDTEEFLPFRQGMLRNISKAHTIYGSGEIIYGGEGVPYARYLYYGKVMVGKPPKHPIDKTLNYDKTAHPLAQAKWFEASKKENLPRWINGVKKIIKKNF